MEPTPEETCMGPSRQQNILLRRPGMMCHCQGPWLPHSQVCCASAACCRSTCQRPKGATHGIVTLEYVVPWHMPAHCQPTAANVANPCNGRLHMGFLGVGSERGRGCAEGIREWKRKKQGILPTGSVTRCLVLQMAGASLTGRFPHQCPYPSPAVCPTF